MNLENMLPASQQPAEGPSALAAYDYALPAECIAAHPASRRVQARLLVLKGDEAPAHHKVAHLTRYLKPSALATGLASLLSSSHGPSGVCH